MQKAYLEQMAKLLVSIVKNLFLTQVSTVTTAVGNAIDGKKDAGKMALTAVDDLCEFSLEGAIEAFRQELEDIIAAARDDPIMSAISIYMERLEVFLKAGLDLELTDPNDYDKDLARAALRVLFMDRIPNDRIQELKSQPSSKGNPRPIAAAIQQAFVETYMPAPGAVEGRDVDTEVLEILQRLKHE